MVGACLLIVYDQRLWEAATALFVFWHDALLFINFAPQPARYYCHLPER